jgi:hypothetical protein
MPGPPPKPDDQRRRRNATVAMTKLPAEGRPGRPPTWPLGTAPSPEERDLWRQLWRTPQAVAWERLGWTRTVARYVAVCLDAERDMHPQLLAETRQLEDRLGLTPMSMLRLRWEIVADEVAEQRQTVESAVTARDRMRAVT